MNISAINAINFKNNQRTTNKQKEDISLCENPLPDNITTKSKFSTLNDSFIKGKNTSNNQVAFTGEGFMEQFTRINGILYKKTEVEAAKRYRELYKVEKWEPTMRCMERPSSDLEYQKTVLNSYREQKPKEPLLGHYSRNWTSYRSKLRDYNDTEMFCNATSELLEYFAELDNKK